MATVILDTIEGSSMSVTPAGYVITRGCLISGVTGNANERVYNALADAGIPAIGAAHPVAALSAYKAARKNILSADESNSIFRIAVEYELPTKTFTIDGDPIWSNAVATEAKQKNSDINGDPLVVTYDGKPQTGTAEVMQPGVVLKAERLESANPLSIAVDYVGFVNSDTFQGFLPGFLLCTRIEGSGNDEAGWKVTYEFQYNIDQWLSTIVYEDENGVVPADITVSDGIEVYDMYDEIAFSGLGL